MKGDEGRGKEEGEGGGRRKGRERKDKGGGREAGRDEKSRKGMNREEERRGRG